LSAGAHPGFIPLRREGYSSVPCGSTCHCRGRGSGATAGNCRCRPARGRRRGEGRAMFPLKSTVPTRHQPFMTWGLILINAAVFLLQAGMSEGELDVFLQRFALIPARYFGGEPLGSSALSPLSYLPFLSNTFLHGGWLHLILNMWTLWLFGPA